MNADSAIISGEVSTTLTSWVPAELISSTPASLTFRVPAPLITSNRIFVRGKVALR